MVRDVAMARALAEVPPEAEALLSGPEAPIVLLPRRADAGVAPGVAPGRPELGLMLPATPLHHLLLRETGFPVVATSGNRSDEPICTDEREALVRLAGMADLFLVHDRPIARHVDDSVARVFAGAPRLLRRARGWAPLPVPVSAELPAILGVGAHMKTAVALSVGRQVFLSQHVGDLETPEALEAFARVVADFERLWGVAPAAVAHDLHPGYASTRFREAPRRRTRHPRVAVQHHHAHLAACLAENEADGPALGVTGTARASARTARSGAASSSSATRPASSASRTCARSACPGGDAAVKEPRRTALAVLFECSEREPSSAKTSSACGRSLRASARSSRRMISSGLNAPVTTSAGRLFDAVASLLGIAQKTSFEGQAAMALEAAALDAHRPDRAERPSACPSP